MLAVLFLGLPYSYAVTVLVGLPYVLLLRALGLLDSWRICIGSTAIGALTLPLYPALFSGQVSYGNYLTVLGAAFGLVNGLAFSIVLRLHARRRAARPSADTLIAAWESFLPVATGNVPRLWSLLPARGEKVARSAG